jgi:hypothetical protein
MFGGTEAVKVFPRLPSPGLCVLVWCGFHYERFAHAPLLPSKENGTGKQLIEFVTNVVIYSKRTDGSETTHHSA